VVQGHDLGEFYRELIEHFRNLLVIRFSPEAQALVENSLVGTEVLQSQAASRSFQELQNILKFFIQSEPMIKQSAYPRFSLEMVLLQASQLKSFLSFDTTLQTIYELGDKFSLFKQIQPSSPHPPLQGDTGESSVVEKAVQMFQGKVVPAA
jgi:DNA polymerase-3 subunit gamma/tau